MRGKKRSRKEDVDDYVASDEDVFESAEECRRSEGRGRRKDNERSRRQCFDPEMYRLNHLSVGGQKKEECIVVKSRLDHQKEKFNMNCRVQNLGRVMGQFCSKKREWVGEMGMEPLFCLQDRTLPRNLCYWLASRVDVTRRKLMCGRGLEFPLTPVQVHWVLGIPVGPNSVPTEVGDGEMKKQVDELWLKYHTQTRRGTKGITRSTILNAVEAPPVDPVVFKRAFMMMLLSDVLCPTTCHRLSLALLPAVTVAEHAKEFDWCSFVLDNLFVAVENFARRFYVDGYAKGCGGCTWFLAVLYLDRLDRMPVGWGAFPRSRVWTAKEINKAKKEDQTILGDFGKLGCIDVAYSEPHPYLGRDALPAGTSLPKVDYLKIKGKGLKRKGPNSELNPYQYKLRAARERARKTGEVDGYVDADGVDDCHGEGYVDADGVEDGHGDGLADEEMEQNNVEAAFQFNENVNHDGDGGVGNLLGLNCFEEAGELPVGEGVCDESNDVRSPVEESNGSRPVEEDDCRSSGAGDWPHSNIPTAQSIIASPEGHQLSGNNLSSRSTVRTDELLEGLNDVVSKAAAHVNDSVPMNMEGCSKYIIGGRIGGIGRARARKPEVIIENAPNLPSESPNMVEKPWGPIVGKNVDHTLERSRKQRKTKSSFRLSAEYFQVWRPAGLTNMRKKLVAFVSMASGQLVSGDTVLIQCSGRSATLQQCATVLNETTHLDENYVRVAGIMYEEVWDGIFVNRSRRIFLDPQFGVQAVSSVDGSVEPLVMKSCVSRLGGIARNKIDLFFVPVFTSHWWCAVFSIKNSEICVIDPVVGDGADVAEQEPVLNKLKKAMDTLLSGVQRTWPEGRCKDFSSYNISMLNGGDSMSSGVQMLAAVKRSAWRLKYDVYMAMASIERSWLLCEDCMCDMNETKADVKQLIQAHMNY